MLEIGGIQHASRVIVAPMAGVTDRPFRDLCREFGAFWLVGEMLTSDQRLWKSRKSQSRQVSLDEAGPRWIQIAGSDPAVMASAARANEAAGADILDINMGCPAKKVCNKAAGSALLRSGPCLYSCVFHCFYLCLCPCLGLYLCLCLCLCLWPFACLCRLCFYVPWRERRARRRQAWGRGLCRDCA